MERSMITKKTYGGKRRMTAKRRKKEQMTSRCDARGITHRAGEHQPRVTNIEKNSVTINDWTNLHKLLRMKLKII